MLPSVQVALKVLQATIQGAAASFQPPAGLSPRSASNFCKLQLLVIEKEMKNDCDFYLPDWPRLHQNQSQRT